MVLSKQVPVGYLELKPLQEQSGRIIANEQVQAGQCIFVGDSNTNKIVRGYIFFNISDLEDLTLKSAKLRLGNPNVWGNPSFMHGTMGTKGLRINVALWGNRGSEALILSDYNLPGQTIIGYTDYDITFTSVAGESSKQFVEMLQDAVNNEYSRFLVRLFFSSETSNTDGQWDGVEYQINDIYLYVTF